MKTRKITLPLGDYTFELKNVKIHEDMSDETTCFSATLYCNGKQLGTCQNEGRGGSSWLSVYRDNPNYELYQKAMAVAMTMRDFDFEKSMEAYQKKYKCPVTHTEYYFDEERLIDNLLDRVYEWKHVLPQLKRFAKKFPTSPIWFSASEGKIRACVGNPGEGYEDVTEYVR